MKPLRSHQPISRRGPLEDGMARANTQNASHSYRSPMTHHESRKPDGQLPLDDDPSADIENRRAPWNTDTKYPKGDSDDRRAALVAVEGKQPAPNRASTYSVASTNASDAGPKGMRKTHIGPWNLGKTLGKGATARVRLARHCVTSERAAIKIVQKTTSTLTTSGSLAALTKSDDDKYKLDLDSKRMPYGIEREVAIMKLIKHPHILRLHDIWENRSEIYLVLEYAEKGELFDHIIENGCLSEMETMKYFRQMLSAIGYCHQFHICHRDLKPENILLTEDMEIRIADFGMAALQQSEEHRLVTSCGSPHYAAPEVIAGTPYKGDKIDVWSLGVILFACLAGSLPFEHSDVAQLLQVIRRGKFNIPAHVSPDAADLIRRILVVNPSQRLSISQIWKHPIIRKYEYLDKFDGGKLWKQPSLHDFEYQVKRHSDIETDLLRSVRSLWHTHSEDYLVDALLNSKLNEQKLFYMLFKKHRDDQLENYVPDTVKYSASDYHHCRPLAQVPKLSTRQFSAVDSHGVRRQISKFTVISNPGAPSRQGTRSTYVPSDAGETIRSYDPFRASRAQDLGAAAASKANVVVHRTTADRLYEERMVSRGYSSIASSRRSAHSPLMPPRRYGTGTRSSLATLASSTHSRRGVISAKPKIGLRYKRGISFSRLQPPQGRPSVAGSDAGIKSPLKLLSPEKSRSPERRVSPTRNTYIRSKKDAGQSPRNDQPFHEDVRSLSRSLAKDCDMAFNFNTSALSTITSSLGDRSHARESTPLSSFEHRDSSVLHYQFDTPIPFTTGTGTGRNSQRYDNRPLPPPPARSESVQKQISAARHALEDRKSVGNATRSSRHLDRMSNHIDRLMVPEADRDKRTVSAPTPPRKTKNDHSVPLAFRHSAGNALENYDARQGSAQTAPEPRRLHKMYGRDAADGKRPTARVVPPSSPGFLVGKEWTNDENRNDQRRKVSPHTDYFTADVPTHVAENTNGRHSGGSYNQRDSVQSDATQKKKMNWFKRSAKEEQVPREALQERTNFPEKSLPEPKKKSFGLGSLFKNKKRAANDDEELRKEFGMVAVNGIDDAAFDDNADEWEHYHRPGKGKEIASRQIEPRQTFLARLFRVKPAVDYVCFNLSRRRARQEMTRMMKEWRQFGMTDVVTDKHRQMIFAKVGKNNSLKMKEVSFAIEVMAVIEHGKKGFLCIARFTQEAGAASSFHTVVKSVRSTMGDRGFLIRDERKIRMMIKTLQSA